VKKTWHHNRCSEVPVGTRCRFIALVSFDVFPSNVILRLFFLYCHGWRSAGKQVMKSTGGLVIR
jgi:hypothetical protein